jgi:tRNA (guanine-N7-)-methyltransferase
VTADDDFRRGGGAFFGRRKGHPLRPKQNALFDEVLPKLALDLTAPAPADMRTLFGPGITDLRVEIGFGGGEHLLAQAEQHPNVGFIGCEPFLNGMVKAVVGLTEKSLPNIRLHYGDAIDLLAWLPAGSVARIDLLYPDPWPKRRHWKRRFVQTERVPELARALRPGGEFRFASDIPDYIAWTLSRVTAVKDFAWTAERADDWRLPWPGFVRTRYEAKAVREGRTPCYLIFRRN